MDKKERYLQWGYCEYKDTETDMVKGNYVQVMNEQVDKISDLEAKLAESEKKVDEFHDKLLDEIQNKVDREVELTNCLNNVVDERDQLKQQLAEKEKEYKFKLKEMDNEYKKEFKTFEEDCKHLYKTETKKAIDELEKVKEWLNIPFDENGCLKNGEDLENYIDQQIAELKGEK